mmetsp:Transcript_25433/g.64062  ORF Transcript_25433/g.64062 Transcript_25433/m.64062 type:complete len:365 (+) Transcript_25433:754-1848(+)
MMPAPGGPAGQLVPAGVPQAPVMLSGGQQQVGVPGMIVVPQQPPPGTMILPQQQPPPGTMIIPPDQQLPPPSSVTGYQLLQQLTQVTIREKVRLSQIFFGWEQANQYQIEIPSVNANRVPGMDNGNTPGTVVMYAHEKSGCFQLQCCPAGVRGWEMTVSMNSPANPAMQPPFPGMNPTGTTAAAGAQLSALAGWQPPSAINPLLPYLYFKKPTACACFCCCRPHVEMWDLQLNTLAGMITNPFECCGMRYLILDNLKNPVLEVHGSSCQPGMCCACPCDPCNKIVFHVKDLATGEKVGEIRKTWGGFLRDWVAGDAGVYEVEFGAVQHPQFKGLLIATALFLSEEYFTKSGTEQRDNSILNAFT